MGPAWKEYGSVISEKLLRGSELAVVMEPFICPGAYIIIGGDLTSNPTPSSAGHIPPLMLCSMLEPGGDECTPPAPDSSQKQSPAWSDCCH